MNIDSCILGNKLNSKVLAHLEKTKNEHVLLASLPETIESDRALRIIDLIFYEQLAHESNFLSLRKIRSHSEVVQKKILINGHLVSQSQSYFSNIISFQSKTSPFFKLEEIAKKYTEESFNQAFEDCLHEITLNSFLNKQYFHLGSYELLMNNMKHPFLANLFTNFKSHHTFNSHLYMAHCLSRYLPQRSLDNNSQFIEILLFSMPRFTIQEAFMKDLDKELEEKGTKLLNLSNNFEFQDKRKSLKDDHNTFQYKNIYKTQIEPQDLILNKDNNYILKQHFSWNCLSDNLNHLKDTFTEISIMEDSLIGTPLLGVDLDISDSTGCFYFTYSMTSNSKRFLLEVKDLLINTLQKIGSVEIKADDVLVSLMDTGQTFHGVIQKSLHSKKVITKNFLSSNKAVYHPLAGYFDNYSLLSKIRSKIS